MFEESIFNADEPARPTVEGEFLHDYEIRSWSPSPRLYKILGASVLVNVLFLVVAAQTSVLTMKGCDSPLVGRVCQALDMVYIGSALFGTDREYVDAVYEKTELADADITFVDVSGVTPPLEYPEGYFALANPEEYALRQQMLNNPGSLGGFTPIPSTSGGLLNSPPVLPSPNAGGITGAIPTDPLGAMGGNAPAVSRKGRRGGKINTPKLPNESPSELPDLGDEQADAKPVPTPLSTEAVRSMEVNKKPLTDFADVVVAKWAANEVDLNQEFTVVLDAVLTKDGKLDPKKSRWDVTKQKGDQKMIDIAKEALEAVGDSGFLTYLTSLDVEKVNITLVQDMENVTAVITSSQKSPERAKTISSGLNGYIMIGKSSAADPSDERTLLEGAKVTAEGTNFVLNFAIPKPIAQEMINRKLREAQAKKAQQQQPSGNAAEKTGGNTAKR